MHQLLEVLHRGASAGSTGGAAGGGSGTAGAEQCPPGIVEDLLAMMEQLGQVMAREKSGRRNGLVLA